MKLFRFDPEVAKEIEQFGSLGTAVARIVHLEEEAIVSCAFIRSHGKIGYHRAVSSQLFLLVEGQGWVRGELEKKYPLHVGQAAFWEKGEGHESGTETGMTAVIIEATKLNPAECMQPVMEDEL